jgi:hypothetical protein
MDSQRVDVIINMTIYNLISLAGLCIQIANAAIERHPEIEIEDERRTAAREEDARQRYIQKRSSGLTPNALTQLRAEAEEKVTKLRIRSALPKIEQYMRMSTNFVVRFDGVQNGYHWPRFYKREAEEPETEKFAREMMTDELREEWRHKAIAYIIAYSYEYWPVILTRNTDFLANHFSTLFPDNEYTDKLEIVYGNNENRRNYVTDEELARVWRLIHATLKLCIKYLHYTGRNTVTANDRTVTVNVAEEIQTWGVDLNVRMDNLQMWARFVTTE